MGYLPEYQSVLLDLLSHGLNWKLKNESGSLP